MANPTPRPHTTPTRIITISGAQSARAPRGLRLVRFTVTEQRREAEDEEDSHGDKPPYSDVLQLAHEWRKPVDDLP